MLRLNRPHRRPLRRGRQPRSSLSTWLSRVRSRYHLDRNRSDGAVVRVAGLVYGSARETSDRLTAYVQALYPALGDYLPE